jgi:hypothetical protein
VAACTVAADRMTILLAMKYSLWICENVYNENHLYYPAICLEVLRKMKNMSQYTVSMLRFEPGTSRTHSKSTNQSTVNTQCEIRGTKRKIGTKGRKKEGKNG